MNATLSIWFIHFNCLQLKSIPCLLRTTFFLLFIWVQFRNVASQRARLGELLSTILTDMNVHKNKIIIYIEPFWYFKLFFEGLRLHNQFPEKLFQKQRDQFFLILKNFNVGFTYDTYLFSGSPCLFDKNRFVLFEVKFILFIAIFPESYFICVCLKFRFVRPCLSCFFVLKVLLSLYFHNDLHDVTALIDFWYSGWSWLFKKRFEGICSGRESFWHDGASVNFGWLFKKWL